MKNDTKEGHPLIQAAGEFPNNPALVHNDSSLNYSELLYKAESLSDAFSSRGVKPGDIICLDDLSPAEMIISIWACSLNSIRVFPINHRYPVTSLTHILKKIQPQLVISGRDLISGLSVTYAELDSAGRNKLAKQPAFYADSPATLLMTSGSSASSKIVQHSHKNHIFSAIGSNLNIPLRQNDRWLLTLPLYHVGSLSILYRTALTGAAVVIPNPQDSISKSISDLQISHVSLVATQFQRILEDSTAIHSLRTMKAILLGGSAIPTDLIQSALAHELPIYVSYGSTEMASQVCTTSSSHRAAALTNSGTLLANRDLVISHEGEILVKGDTLAQGYLDGNDLVNLRDKDGWFHTGDVGYVDPKGALTITGRMDNQFVSGGENIQPEHIENILNKIPDIAQAIILPQSDEEFGTRPVAFLQLINTNISLEKLEKNLRISLPGYMIPIAFYYLPEHLTTDLLKISRHELSKYVLDPNNHLHPLE